MFSKKIFQNLKEGKSISLDILLEEKDEDIFDKMDDEEEGSSDEESSSEEEGSSDEESSSEEEGSSEEEEGSSEEEGSDEVTKAQFDELLKNLANIKKLILRTTDQKGTGGIEAFIGSTVAKNLSQKSTELVDSDDLEDLGESISRILNKSKINNFIFESEDDLESIEDDIDNLDRILNKGTELVDTFKKGQDIDIQSYVSASINAYKNFDNLFSKEEIIKQATINVIVLNSGSKAEANVKEFEELFHEELHKNFGIEYDEYALITKKNKTAAGAKSQG